MDCYLNFASHFKAFDLVPYRSQFVGYAKTSNTDPIFNTIFNTIFTIFTTIYKYNLQYSIQYSNTDLNISFVNILQNEA